MNPRYWAWPGQGARNLFFLGQYFLTNWSLPSPQRAGRTVHLYDFGISASKVQTEESFAQSVIKCPDLVQTMLRKAEGEKTGDM